VTDNDTLTPRQRRFVNALITAPSVRSAAQESGVGEKTAWRYLALPAVRAELSLHGDVRLAEVSRRLALAMGRALDVLIVLMSDSGLAAERGASARVSAARAVLDSGLRMAELVTLATRVAELEQRIGGDE
jgi:phage terminase small subunit